MGKEHGKNFLHRAVPARRIIQVVVHRRIEALKMRRPDIVKVLGILPSPLRLDGDPIDRKHRRQHMKAYKAVNERLADLRREAILRSHAVFVQIPDARTAACDQIAHLRQRLDHIDALQPRSSRAEGDLNAALDRSAHGLPRLLRNGFPVRQQRAVQIECRKPLLHIPSSAKFEYFLPVFYQ